MAVQLHRFSPNRPTNDCRQNPISAPVSPTPLPSRAARPVQARALRPFNPGAHHGDQETHSEEGSEGEAPGQDRSEEVRQGSEGAWPVNLTVTQAYHRSQNLGGEIKAALSALADCEADAAAKLRIAEVSVEGVEKAKATLAALYAERDELADHMAALVRQTGDAPATIAENANEGLAVWDGAAVQIVLEGGPCDVVVSEPFADFGHPTQNGLDQGVNEALDRARSV